MREKDWLFAHRYGSDRVGHTPYSAEACQRLLDHLFPERKKEHMQTSVVLNITRLDNDRYRVQIPHTGAYGIYAEAPDAPAAAAQALKLYLATGDVQLAPVTQQDEASLEVPVTFRYHSGIRTLLEQVIDNSGAARIEYTDEDGDDTVRTIHPYTIYDGPNAVVSSWCDHAQDYRNFRLDRIESARQVFED